ncbi:unnamed protein product [Urochloa humidicola]
MVTAGEENLDSTIAMDSSDGITTNKVLETSVVDLIGEDNPDGTTEALKTFSNITQPTFEDIPISYSLMYLYDCMFHGADLPKPVMMEELLDQIYNFI